MTRPCDLYLKKNSKESVVSKRVEDLLMNHSMKAVYLHGLGAAIGNVIDIALAIQKQSLGVYRCSVTTDTIPIYDDYLPKYPNLPPITQQRFNSSITIKIDIHPDYKSIFRKTFTKRLSSSREYSFQRLKSPNTLSTSISTSTSTTQGLEVSLPSSNKKKKKKKSLKKMTYTDLNQPNQKTDQPHSNEQQPKKSKKRKLSASKKRLLSSENLAKLNQQ